MRRWAAAAVMIVGAALPAPAMDYVETPFFADPVSRGDLPPVAQRLPLVPSVVPMTLPWQKPGLHGGQLRMLASQPRDTRLMVVYGYARLVGYDTDWTLVPDILERVEVEGGRIFTLHLRKGHKWSDGHPFTSNDFRFFWEDEANNDTLSPAGPDRFLRVDGVPPTFEVISETAVRYTWPKPNPFFLPALAGARPEYIFVPAHYMKQFHPRHTDEKLLAERVAQAGQRDWASLYTNKGRQYRNDNPDLPTLEPWVLKTKPPSTYLTFDRNPFYHRVDAHGRQLPYIDSVSVTIAAPGLIPAKTAAGDADLQARSLGFDNIAVLKQGEKRGLYRVLLWTTGLGSQLALYPNLNTTDPQLAALVRTADFRRALSLAINRNEINQVVYIGLARPGADTVLPQSPLFEPDLAKRWSGFDLKQANALLDAIGLTDRDGRGIRKLRDGRPLQIVVETAGEVPSEVAVLQLIKSTWQKIGIDLFIKPEQREILRNRVFAGEAALSVWFGLENALATARSSPHELAPTSQQQLNWPKWGQYFETGGRIGEPVDLPAAKELADLNQRWIETLDDGEKARIWKKMLAIRADQQFSIGTVREVPQPVVVNVRLRNVPEKGLYNWEPGAHFGMYRPDTFWFAPPGQGD